MRCTVADADRLRVRILRDLRERQSHLRSTSAGAKTWMEVMRMRSGGFPCRYDDCDATFTVEDGSSMASLQRGSAQRSEHEIGVHGYRHVVLDLNPQRSIAPALRRVPPR
jgi:hypothetical protein